MVVHSEKEAHVVRLTQQLELLVAHPERVGQIVRTPAAYVTVLNLDLLMLHRIFICTCFYSVAQL